MKYIIMAGGRAVRWRKYKNTTKHLVKIGNENMLERIVRQLKDNNIDEHDISITSDNPLYELNGICRNPMIYDCKMYNMFYYKALNSEVTFLYGDTFYTDAAIKKIIATKTDDNIFFGSSGSIVGVKVVNYKRFKRYVYKMKGYQDGRAGWALYRKINHLPDNSVEHCSNYVQIDEEIINVNSPGDYELLLEKLEGEKNE